MTQEATVCQDELEILLRQEVGADAREFVSLTSSLLFVLLRFTMRFMKLCIIYITCSQSSPPHWS